VPPHVPGDDVGYVERERERYGQVRVEGEARKSRWAPPKKKGGVGAHSAVESRERHMGARRDDEATSAAMKGALLLATKKTHSLSRPLFRLALMRA